MDQTTSRQLYHFTSRGVGVGVNIFDRYRFKVCRFTDFESRLVLMDNDSLCEALDYFLAVRHAETDAYADQEIIITYLECLLSLRVHEHTDTHCIPEWRSDIAHFYRCFPYLDSSLLANCFSNSGVALPSLSN